MAHRLAVVCSHRSPAPPTTGGARCLRHCWSRPASACARRNRCSSASQVLTRAKVGLFALKAVAAKRVKKTIQAFGLEQWLGERSAACWSGKPAAAAPRLAALHHAGVHGRMAAVDFQVVVLVAAQACGNSASILIAACACSTGARTCFSTERPNAPSPCPPCSRPDRRQWGQAQIAQHAVQCLVEVAHGVHHGAIQIDDDGVYAAGVQGIQVHRKKGRKAPAQR